MSALKIIVTADGSHSIFNDSLQETYHSVHGAVQESMHVFIQSGLEFYRTANKINSIKTFEVGFGTGLNTWLALQWARNENCSINYVSVEAFPLEESIWSLLNYADDRRADEFYYLHKIRWDEECQVDEQFSLKKINARLEDIQLEEASYDVIFFDAFAPGKQPEMWSLSILEKIERAMKEGGVFVTYCAKGQLKRDLRALQMVVETLPGPPGKNEMIRATKMLRT
ncbi:MAG: tRNA (5-methylaminomethyl-2-thiouridine)(34)-methyltransferase MnmD [Chryseolinea sp.]